MTPAELAKKLEEWRQVLGLVIGRNTSDGERLAQVDREMAEAWVEAVRERENEERVRAAYGIPEPSRPVRPELRAVYRELTPSTFEPTR